MDFFDFFNFIDDDVDQAVDNHEVNSSCEIDESDDFRELEPDESSEPLPFKEDPLDLKFNLSDLNNEEQEDSSFRESSDKKSLTSGIISFKGYSSCCKCDCKAFEGIGDICQNCYHHYDAHY
ncbi:MAG: hypothetical protein D3910_27795 [Candidatus Electrothrix sp. ATG2]|nr:hypothetical protein [Candidatus Electrothrix sp. ATG2]